MASKKKKKFDVNQAVLSFPETGLPDVKFTSVDSIEVVADAIDLDPGVSPVSGPDEWTKEFAMDLSAVSPALLHGNRPMGKALERAHERIQEALDEASDELDAEVELVSVDFGDRDDTLVVTMAVVDNSDVEHFKINIVSPPAPAPVEPEPSRTSLSAARALFAPPTEPDRELDAGVFQYESSTVPWLPEGYLLLVEGSRLTPETIERLQAFYEAQKRGERHGIIVLETEADADFGPAKISVVPLHPQGPIQSAADFVRALTQKRVAIRDRGDTIIPTELKRLPEVSDGRLRVSVKGALCEAQHAIQLGMQICEPADYGLGIARQITVEGLSYQGKAKDTLIAEFELTAPAGMIFAVSVDDQLADNARLIARLMPDALPSGYKLDELQLMIPLTTAGAYRSDSKAMIRNAADIKERIRRGLISQAHKLLDKGKIAACGEIAITQIPSTKASPGIKLQGNMPVARRINTSLPKPAQMLKDVVAKFGFSAKEALAGFQRAGDALGGGLKKLGKLSPLVIGSLDPEQKAAMLGIGALGMPPEMLTSRRTQLDTHQAQQKLFEDQRRQLKQVVDAHALGLLSIRGVRKAAGIEPRVFEAQYQQELVPDPRLGISTSINKVIRLAAEFLTQVQLSDLRDMLRDEQRGEEPSAALHDLMLWLTDGLNGLAPRGRRGESPERVYEGLKAGRYRGRW